jgi:hypothetical protein
MKPLALVLVIFAGDALISFAKQCELDVLVACANQTAGKNDGDQMDSCAAKALGVGAKMVCPRRVQGQLRLHGRRRV